MNNENLKVLFNILVVKETPKSYSFYNTDSLFWDSGCFLDKYFIKQEGLSINLIEISLKKLINSWKIDQSLLSFINKSPIQYKIPSKIILWNMIEMIRLDLNLPVVWNKMDIIDEIPSILNSFTTTELSENLELLDIPSILWNIEISSYIKDKIKAIASLNRETEILKAINKIENKQERIEKKKTYLQKFKEIWKKTIVWWLLALSFYSAIGWDIAFAKSWGSSHSSSSSSSHSSSSSSSHSSSSSSSHSSSSNSSYSSSSTPSSSRSSWNNTTSSNNGWGGGSSLFVVPIPISSSPSRTESHLSNKIITITQGDITVNSTGGRSSYWQSFIQLSDISWLITAKQKTWSEQNTWTDWYTDYVQTENLQYWNSFSTKGYEDYYIVQSFWERFEIKGTTISSFDSVYIQLTNWKVYKLHYVSSPSTSVSSINQVWTRNIIPLNTISLVDKNSWISITNTGSITAFVYSTSFLTQESIPNTPDTYVSTTNTLTKHVIRKTNYNTIELGSIWNVTKTVNLNINDSNVDFSINWKMLGGGEHILLNQNGITTMYNAVAWSKILNFTISSFELQDWFWKTIVLLNNVAGINITDSWSVSWSWIIHNYTYWSPKESSWAPIEININESSSIAKVNWQQMTVWQRISVTGKDWKVINYLLVSHMTRKVKDWIFWILIAMWLGLLFMKFYPNIKEAIERTRDWQKPIDQEEVDSITTDILKRNKKQEDEDSEK